MNQQMADRKDEILGLQQRWTEAELRGDVAALDALLDDDFLAVGPFGFLLTKAEWLDRHRSGDLKYQAIEWGDTSIRQYGDTAILVGEQSQKATFQGNAIPITRMRATVIAVRRRGGWVVAGTQLSMIAPPPGR